MTLFCPEPWRTAAPSELVDRPPKVESPGMGATATSMSTRPSPVIVPDTDETRDTDKPWQVVVWNDPVNTMGYVVYVFRKLFGYDETKATDLMLQVHHEGRAIVSDGPREQAELDCFRLHNHGLWATVEQ